MQVTKTNCIFSKIVESFLNFDLVNDYIIIMDIREWIAWWKTDCELIEVLRYSIYFNFIILSDPITIGHYYYLLLMEKANFTENIFSDLVTKWI